VIENWMIKDVNKGKFVLPNFGNKSESHLESSVKVQMFVWLGIGEGSPQQG